MVRLYLGVGILFVSLILIACGGGGEEAQSTPTLTAEVQAPTETPTTTLEPPPTSQAAPATMPTPEASPPPQATPAPMPVVDQQQTDTGGCCLVIGGSSEQKLAQVITAGLTGVLIEVRLELGGTSGNLIVEIQEVSAGQPTGVVLTFETIPAGALSSTCCAPPFESIVFSSPVSFSAGDQFAVVLKSTASHGTVLGPIGDPYLGGDSFFDSRPNPPGWVCRCEFDRFDLAVETLVDPAER